MEQIISEKQGSWKTIGVGVVICAGLLARDMAGVNVNKFIFLFLVAIPIFGATLDQLIPFSGFLIPLYVGLPGNYLSVLLLVRLMYELFCGNIVLDQTGLMLSYAVAGYILIQDFMTGHTGIYNIMAALDFINLYVLLTAALQRRQLRSLILAFIISTFVVGIIMLCSTLKYYSLEQLMNPATRLGDTGMLIESSGANMVTSIDPNFYAMNVIAALSTGCLLAGTKMPVRSRLVLIVSMIGATICCLIGLSRTFIVLLALWGVLWLVSQGDLKRTMAVLFAGCIAIIAFFNLMPTVAEGLLDRFTGSDVIGGNGRINLILRYYQPWIQDIYSTLFGIGLFNCHTHCAPLLYLFGLGIVGTIPLLSWFVHCWGQCRQYVSNVSARQCVPVIVTFVSFSTLPAAGAIHYTLPMLMAACAVIIDTEE